MSNHSAPSAATQQKPDAVMSPALLRSALAYIIKGGLRVPGGHIPPAGHRVPDDFTGVCVTAAADPAVDDYILDRLAELAVRNVRIDISYGDEDGPVERLLSRLLATGLQVMIHLVQPFDEARMMSSLDCQQRWRQFVRRIVERFGAQASSIEVGTTINRRRWTGYDTEGFFVAWRIAHDEIRAGEIRLAGPNITDFEPIYTISVLDRLAHEQRLPDCYTNNLFSERVTEPERFDHRILGIGAARKLQVNLVKKARMLHKVVTEHGIREQVSPAAFWTLPRIERLLVDSEDKQADYLSRYFVLLAASGALHKAFWGPLLCWREGLIDDGSGRYPELERITHYRSVTGDRNDFSCRPAFAALKQFNALIPGTVYEAPLQTADGIEVHAFRSEHHLIHVAWTGNGKGLRMQALYHERDWLAANAVGATGERFDDPPHFLCETPVYLLWPADSDVRLKSIPDSPKLEALHAHRKPGRYYSFDRDGWTGVYVAEGGEAQAAAVAEALHPDRLPAADETTTLRKARNLIWRVPGATGEQLVAKRPIKVQPHKRLIDRFKPSKARRSWTAAAELGRRGIPTAEPVAFFERAGDRSLMRNVYLCACVQHDFSARDMLEAFAQGACEYRGVPDESAYRQLADFVRNIHDHGVFFRDLAGGNILIRKTADGRLHFTLIDINRARFYQRGTPLRQRLADLTRICNKLHWAGRHQLVTYYLQQLHRPTTFSLRYRLPFYLYDFKVGLKRRIGRKAIRRGWHRLSALPLSARIALGVALALLLWQAVG